MFILSIILIPIWCIVLTLYIMGLYSFSTTGEFDTIMIILPLVASILLSYISPLVISKSFGKQKSPKCFEIEDRIISVGGYISFIYLLLFGLSLLINGIIIQSNFIYILCGVAFLVIFIYITFEIIKKDDIELELTSIEALSENVFLISFANEFNEVYEFYSNTDKYKIKKKYKLRVNKLLKKVYRIENK